MHSEEDAPGSPEEDSEEDAAEDDFGDMEEGAQSPVRKCARQGSQF